MASKEQIEGLKAKAQELLDAVQALPVDDQPAAPAPAPAPEDLSAKLAELQEKFDALGKERDAYKDAIQAEIDDSKADSKRLEKAIEPVVPVEVPVVADVVPVPDAPAADPVSVDTAARALNP